MNPIDITELAAHADEIIGGLPSHRTKGPILVTRHGQPEAVIICHQAYAPRLHDFSVDQGGIRCHHCDPAVRIVCDSTSLGVAVETANRHWRDNHQELARTARQQPRMQARVEQSAEPANVPHAPVQGPAREQS